MCKPCWDLDIKVWDTLLTTLLGCQTIFGAFLSIGTQRSARLGV